MGFDGASNEQCLDVYDVRKLAQLLDVKTGTIRTMKARGQLPAPLGTINGGSVWGKGQIGAWLHENGDGWQSVYIKPGTSLPSVIDLFAGCGGMSLGFGNAGFSVIAGFDNWPKAIQTYNQNFEHPCHDLDLGDLDGVVARLAPYLEEADIIIGGPPCQDFSSAGKRLEAGRADLTQRFAEIVARLKPRVFVMENVSMAVRAKAFARALTIFEDAGYSVDFQVLDASLCGVPQKRKRLFTIGFLQHDVSALFVELRKRPSAKPMSVRDYMGDELDIDCYYRHPRTYSRRGVFSVDEPSPTIRGVNRPVPPGYAPHAGDVEKDMSKVRPLTTRERACLQTFPRSFIFPQEKSVAEQLIGNAVPVNLARYVATILAKHIPAI